VTDLVFVLAYVLCIAGIIAASRSLTATVVLVFGGFTVSGVILQDLGDAGLEVNIGVLRIWLAVTLAVIALAAFLVRQRIATRWSPQSNLILLGLSGGIALAFSLSRLIAPGAPTPLSSVGFFVTRIAAEDNAKWLNATAALANGSAVDVWANVGGPLVLVLTFSATVISAISYVLYGAVNEVAVSSGSLLFTELLLIVLAPLALAPLAEKRFKKLDGNQIPWPLILLSGATLAAGSTVLLAYGHLTLQYTIPAFVLWIAIFLAPDTNLPWRKLTTLGIAGTAMVWFPLSALSVFVLFALGLYLVVAVVRRSGRQRLTAGVWLVITLGFTYVLFSFLLSSLKFSLGFGATTAQIQIGGGGGRGISTIALPSLPLFSDPGGTEKITVLMLILVVLSVMAAAWFRSGAKPLKFSTVVPYFPIITLTFFVTLIFLADFWSVGDGPNYAAQKMAYATLLPILVVTIPYLILVIPGGKNVTTMGLLRWFGVGIIVMVLSFDTLYPRALMQLKPRIWPSTADSPYWYPAEVRATGNQDLSSNPIGCLYLPRGADKPSALPSGQRAYSCTRLLSGVAGVELIAAPIVKWQLDEWLLNNNLWDERYGEFSALSADLLSRSFILLDQDSNVVGLETLGTLLNRYQPTLAPTS
jgi:hypothetical protein